MRGPTWWHGITLALFALAAPAPAQDTTPATGQATRLTLQDGSKIQGRFTAWTTDTVRVERDGSLVAIPRDQIVRWEVPVPGTRRSRWLAGLGWGALAGTVGGAVLGVAATGGGDCSGGGWCIMADLGRGAYAVAGASMGLLVGSVTGAAVGAMLHAEQWYDRPEFLRR